MQSPLLKSTTYGEEEDSGLISDSFGRRGNPIPKLIGSSLVSTATFGSVSRQNMHSRQVSKQLNKLSFIPIFWFATLSIWCLSIEWSSFASNFALLPKVVEGTSLGSKTASLGTQAQSIDQQEAAKAALEAELNSIVQQHDAGALDGNPKLLSEAIISRLMLDNLTSSTPQINELIGQGSDGAGLDINPPSAPTNEAPSSAIGESYTDQQQQQLLSSVYTAPERWRLKKLLSMLRNYDMISSADATGATNTNQMFNQYPVLPASQAATMKRAAMRMSNLLRQQQQQQRLTNGYGRNNFDFGLGKRPDSMAGANNILRLGDSSLGADGHVQAVGSMGGQFGKRPSAHRFDFGLGKRVASVSIIREPKIN